MANRGSKTTGELFEERSALLANATHRWTTNREQVDISGALYDIEAELEYRDHNGGHR